jgi:inositol oxygenase
MDGAQGITYRAKVTVLRALRSAGYELNSIERSVPEQYRRAAQPILDRRDRQTVDDVRALRAKYEAPVFGEISMWDALNMLAHVIDLVDPYLMNVSQEVHTLQVVEGIVAEGADDDLVLAGLIHDVGKLLYLVDEDPANISGSSAPVDTFEPGIGLDRCVLQFGADEFSHSRVAGRVPDHVSWLVRYHSIVPESCEPLMDDRDREYYARYWPTLSRLDHETKSMSVPPRTRLRDYRSLIDDAFPEPIPF